MPIERIGLSLIGYCSVILVACEAAQNIDESSSQERLVEYSKPAADAPELAYWGDYSVGLRTATFVDEERLALLDIDPETGFPRTTDRSISSLVWYPAAPGADTLHRASYDRQFIQDPKWPMPDFPRNWSTFGHGFGAHR